MKALVNLKSKAKAGAGQTALHRACGALNIKAMKLLLAEGALINDRDAKGWTPIRHALRKYGPKAHGKIEPVIRLLIDAGADVGLADNEGRSPAQSAAARAPRWRVWVFCWACVRKTCPRTMARRNGRGKNLNSVARKERACRKRLK